MGEPVAVSKPSSYETFSGAMQASGHQSCRMDTFTLCMHATFPLSPLSDPQ